MELRGYAVVHIHAESQVWMSNASIREARRIIVVCAILYYIGVQLHRVNVLMVVTRHYTCSVLLTGFIKPYNGPLQRRGLRSLLSDQS